eukprot:874397-Prymnesium_polylepis.1
MSVCHKSKSARKWPKIACRAQARGAQGQKSSAARRGLRELLVADRLLGRRTTRLPRCDAHVAVDALRIIELINHIHGVRQRAELVEAPKEAQHPHRLALIGKQLCVRREHRALRPRHEADSTLVGESAARDEILEGGHLADMRWAVLSQPHPRGHSYLQRVANDGEARQLRDIVAAAQDVARHHVAEVCLPCSVRVDSSHAAPRAAVTKQVPCHQPSLPVFADAPPAVDAVDQRSLNRRAACLGH